MKNSGPSYFWLTRERTGLPCWPKQDLALFPTITLIKTADRADFGTGASNGIGACLLGLNL